MVSIEPPADTETTMWIGFDGYGASARAAAASPVDAASTSNARRFMKVLLVVCFFSSPSRICDGEVARRAGGVMMFIPIHDPSVASGAWLQAPKRRHLPIAESAMGRKA